MQSVIKNFDEAPNNDSNFFSRLMKGDYGLPKTYWIFGVLVGFLYRIVVTLTLTLESLGVFSLIYLAGCGYFTVVFIGVWRASERYKGPVIWAGLAKVAVILGGISILTGLILMVKLL